MNIKHGIDPRSARKRHDPFRHAYSIHNPRRSRAKVTLPTVSI